MQVSTQVVHPLAHAATVPFLRTWAYLLGIGGSYSGTIGDLYEGIKASRGLIGRRSLPDAIRQLELSGMVTVYRRGHHVEIEVVRG